MTPDSVHTLLADSRRLLDSAKDDYENQRLDNHSYFVSELNTLLERASGLDLHLSFAKVAEAEKDEVHHVSSGSGTPYNPPMVQSYGSKSKKLREVINTAGKLVEDISSAAENEVATNTKKRRALAQLQKLTKAIEPLKQSGRDSAEFRKWKRNVDVAIREIFPKDSDHLREMSISYYPSSTYLLGIETRDPSEYEYQTAFVTGLTTARLILESMIEEIETYWEDEPTAGSESKSSSEFWRLLHPAITGISKSRFDAGHFADSVETALKYINGVVKALVKKRTGQEFDGSDLMNRAFSPNNPVLTLDDISTEDGKNIQKGYMQIFAGAMTGIRNPKAHSVVTIDETRAIHFLFLASLLMYKIDEVI